MPAASPARILLVDDDVGLRRLVEKALRREGYATAAAASGQEAITWLSHDRADLMLLDLQLPDLKGQEVVGRLAESGRAVPFVIITGQGDERVAVEMMKRGALDYLAKDGQFLELVPTVARRALAQVDKDRRLAQAEKQARQLQKEVLEVSESEQRRIGRDLHDGLGQHLTALELLSQALVGKIKTAAPELVKPAQEITRQIRETITQTRLLSHNLSPVPLAADGLMLALSELAAGTQGMAGINCEFQCAEPVLLSDAQAATHLYRITQEAVNNALKHSGAAKIEISLSEHAGSWHIAVQDDGRGFSPDADRNSGLGLRLMRYRAQLLGASLEIDSAPRRGARVSCTLQKPS
jgi:signal transduction histidine kinase